MNSDSLQQHMALAVAMQVVATLAVACQLHDQLPFLAVRTPSQSVFHGWSEKNGVGAHRQDAGCSKITKAECQLSSTGNCFANV